MDISEAFSIAQDPVRYLAKSMAASNPQQWQQAQRMMQGKSHRQQVDALRKLYKSKDMDLDTVARQWGISL